MSKKIFAFIILLSCVSVLSYGQNKKTAIIKGRLFNTVTKAAFSDLKVTIPSLNVFTTSDGEGNFEISEIPYGTVNLVISAYNATSKTISVVVDKDVVDLKTIDVVPNDKGASVESTEIPTIAIEESNTTTDDDGVSSQSAGNLIIANGDPFIYTTAYIFGPYWFQPRGYSRNSEEVQVNGIAVNDVETGNASWSQFGGLGDVFRGRDIKYGLAPSVYTFGGVNGSAYIDATAADQRQENRFTYTATDRNYRNRIMLTSNTGLMSNGWAFSFSGSKRWADQGYIPGTFYNGYSYYAAASKVIRRSQFNFTAFGSPTIHAKGGSADTEAYHLAGTNYYNQYWGYQNGQVRSSKIENVFQPIFILNYEYKPDDKTRWNTAIGYQFGKDKTSGLDWYNAADPYGDYYKYMPSYFLTSVTPQPSVAAAVRQEFMSNPNKLQIDWDGLYQSNYSDQGTFTYGNYSRTGKESEYILNNTVSNLKKFTFNSNIEHAVNEHLTLYGGVTLISQSTESYEEVADLLGGDFFVNFNQFASQQYIGSPTYNYNNLNNPDPFLTVGDKYGYDYTIRYLDALAWGQAVYTFDKFEIFAAATAGDNSFDRDGYMRNGLFPNNSFGESPMQNFFTYSAKGGVNYKIDGRNFLFINAAYMVTPPTSDNTYISAETRDFTVPDPTVQHTQSMEAGYLLKSPTLSARVAGYVTDTKDATNIERFYDDDPAYETEVNYVMTNVDTRSIGTEVMLNYKFTRAFSVTGVASVGQTFYSNQPDVNIYLDNSPALYAPTTTTYLKNYYLAVGPQSAYTIGLNYHPRGGWFATMNFNYFDRNYVEVNPDRLTTAAAGYVNQATQPQQWAAIFGQEELPAAFTVDLRAGKNFQLSRMSKRIDKLSHNTILSVTGGINNLLNNTNIINFGYEQLRYDFEYANPAEFPNKYIYGLGINFYLNVSLRF